MTWIVYVLCHVCHGVFGGRLRYSRYAVRPYIGGMYHQIDCMSDLDMFQLCLWAHIDPFLCYCDWVCRISRVGILVKCKMLLVNAIAIFN